VGRLDGLAGEVELAQRRAAVHRHQVDRRLAPAAQHDAATVALLHPAADVVEAVGLGTADVRRAQLVAALW
jgi:hypothetical protein